jgi:nucleotide-binding universal stress UspA family protein
MFTSLIVAVDLTEDGDRSLGLADELARLGPVPVELVTVSSPGVDADVDTFELRRRAAAHGWPPDCCTILHSNDVAAALLAHMGQRPDGLLVMATTAKGPAASLVLGSVTEEVLRHYTRPVLLVGPHVPPQLSLGRPTLVACVEASGIANEAVPTIVDWMTTFHGDPPWVVEVQPPVTALTSRHASAVEPADVKHIAARLAADGVNANWEVMHGGPPEQRLDEFADGIHNPLFVATSSRWTDEHPRWHSTTRRLVRRSRRPVLVVPAMHQRQAAKPIAM